MKIAFVSYEYPPDTSHGGIATYVDQVAKLMSRRGHSVEVFAASDRRSGHFEHDKVGVNLIGEMDHQKFTEAIAPVFSKRHALCGFDVVESPENNADGRYIRSAHPQLAHVVKLHTPHELLDQIMTCPPSFRGWLRHNYSQARICCGALRRLQSPHYQCYNPNSPKSSHLYPIERNFTQSCDLVVSPSQAMAEWATRNWSIPASRIMLVPLPYEPAQAFFGIPGGGKGNVVGFFGRLEQRKGVADLIEAIPLILRVEPDTRFRFVGRPIYYPATNEMFDEYLLRRLKPYHHAIELIGFCNLDEMPEQYAAVDICVFPSVWESYGLVCVEAMAAGRAIVASNAGGMPEILEGGRHGLLIPPKNPQAIADGVIRMLQSPEQRLAMGASGRQRVLDEFSMEKVGPQLERSFEKAIALRRQGL